MDDRELDKVFAMLGKMYFQLSQQDIMIKKLMAAQGKAEKLGIPSDDEPQRP